MLFTVHDFNIGTPTQKLSAQFVFSEPDVVVATRGCMSLHNKCPQYCNHPTFCMLYCNPTCCSSTANIVKQCNWRPDGAYDYNSTSRDVQRRYWQAVFGDSAGVYAKEKIDMEMINGRLVLEDYTIALNALMSLNSFVEQERSFHRIGLRRRTDGSSFVMDLYKNGLIASPMLSICRSSAIRGRSRMNFGALCTYCNKEEYHFVPLVQGSLEFMMDVRSAVVFDYKVHRKHRMTFTESPILYVPHDFLTYLLEEGILRYERSFVYRVEKEFPYKFRWNLSDVYSIDLDTSTVISVLKYESVIYIETLQPNPDDLRWILSNSLFYEYSVALDYEENRIGFAKMKTYGQACEL
ncbi:unnamed protein product [Bursaphelenchus xylophilus]|uniref:(pine wood nematode) hypothetical protein n=1 Tax=Bursaphelenchus xylophilus TaxID=6326 RepID=A0A811JY47_BURXY|nr:unnamed protein product [Bursaphelenchus xylophilus]CAG9080507.1 unnamed protein product [Bursaphelenchus xylophilus]